MSENLVIPPDNLSKEEKYKELLPQIIALTEGEVDWLANVSNVIAALKQGLHFFWIGIYFVKPLSNNSIMLNNKDLVLGPFQGHVACTRIGYG